MKTIHFWKAYGISNQINNVAICPESYMAICGRKMAAIYDLYDRHFVKWRPYMTRGKWQHCFSDCLYHELSKNVYFSYSPKIPTALKIETVNLTSRSQKRILKDLDRCQELTDSLRNQR